MAAMPGVTGAQAADEAPPWVRYLEVARGAWPDSPCRGTETVEVVEPDESGALPTSAGLIRPTPGLHIIGVAVPDRCWVAVSADLTGYKLCAALVHEFGHLAGVSHSDDPASIMAPVMPKRDAPCIVQTFGALTAHRAAMAVRGRHGVSGRLRCRVVTSVVAVCSERRRRRTREFVVEQTWTGLVDIRQLHAPTRGTRSVPRWSR